MNTIARITAIILIILGILVMLGGVATVVIGAVVRSGQRALSAAPVRPAVGLAGLLTGFGLAVYLFVQGMIVVATGEGLYLLANLARKMPSA